MSPKLCWHSSCVRRAARTMLGITSRCRRHSCSCSGTSSRQCWLSFQDTPLPARPLWREGRVTAGPPRAPRDRQEGLWKEGPLLTATGWLRTNPAGRAARWQRRRGGPWLGKGLGTGMGLGQGLGAGLWPLGPITPFIAAMVAGPAPRGGEQRRFRCHSQVRDKEGLEGGPAVTGSGRPQTAPGRGLRDDLLTGCSPQHCQGRYWPCPQSATFTWILNHCWDTTPPLPWTALSMGNFP